MSFQWDDPILVFTSGILEKNLFGYINRIQIWIKVMVAVMIIKRDQLYLMK